MTSVKLQFRFCNRQELPEIIQILKEVELPTEDVDLDKIVFILATVNMEIVGCIGLESYGKHGLLRSMAVKKTFQNQGIGSKLFSNLQAHGIQMGIQHLHLFTDTSDSFFLSRGFGFTNREHAPYSIQTTSEFTYLCPSNSCNYMVKPNLQKQILQS
jgi:amino-acid N-acetyltransferase